MTIWLTYPVQYWKRSYEPSKKCLAKLHIATFTDTMPCLVVDLGGVTRDSTGAARSLLCDSEAVGGCYVHDSLLSKEAILAVNCVA